jgi:hypothetical protein
MILLLYDLNIAYFRCQGMWNKISCASIYFVMGTRAFYPMGTRGPFPPG